MNVNMTRVPLIGVAVVAAALLYRPATVTGFVAQPPASSAAQSAADDVSAQDIVSAAYQSNLADMDGLRQYGKQKGDEEHEAAMKEAFTNEMNAEFDKWWKEHHPPVGDGGGGGSSEKTTVTQSEVISIEGDSSDAPPDEITDGDPDGGLAEPRASGPSADPWESLADARIVAGPASSLTTPLTVVTRRADGLFELRAYTPHGLALDARRALLRTEAVVTPLDAARQRAVERSLVAEAAAGSGAHLTRVAFRGYCVEAAKLPPAVGTMFVFGTRAAQEQFAPARVVRALAVFAARNGYLRPQGDSRAYGRFVAQYAIWTSIEHWDQARFTTEVLSRTKRDMAAAKQPWTGETEQTLRALAPARWRDVQLVIRAAAIVDTNHRLSGGTQ